MIGAGVARVRLQVIPAPVRAVKPLHYRGTDFGCPTCGLPPILD
jgi:hypothetical protein